MATSVVHFKKDPYDIYIGRPSDWGCPFAVGVDGSRREIITRHRIWMGTQPQLLARLGELKDKVLGCWCKPMACHGDTLAFMADHFDQEHDCHQRSFVVECNDRTETKQCEWCGKRWTYTEEFIWE